MDQVRTPCNHRGGPEVVTTTVTAGIDGEVQFCICKACRRFWLERGGWLLSRRETMSLLRSWPFVDQLGTVAQ